MHDDHSTEASSPQRWLNYQNQRIKWFNDCLQSGVLGHHRFYCGSGSWDFLADPQQGVQIILIPWVCSQFQCRDHPMVQSIIPLQIEVRLTETPQVEASITGHL